MSLPLFVIFSFLLHYYSSQIIPQTSMAGGVPPVHVPLNVILASNFLNSGAISDCAYALECTT